MSETLSVGKETLEDVISALRQPGRDMRDDLAAPILRKDILKWKI